jgi:hypothetical protein
MTANRKLGSYSGQGVAVLGRYGGKTSYSSVPGCFAERWNIVLEFAQLDLASNFPNIPAKLVVAPIAPNTKEDGFEEFALSIDGTFDCPLHP